MSLVYVSLMNASGYRVRIAALFRGNVTRLELAHLNGFHLAMTTPPFE